MTDLVVVELEMRRFGLPAEHVQELVRAVAITPLAGAPRGVAGVIDVRGTVIPVYDLRRRLAIANRAVRTDEYLVICRTALRLLAIRVDRIVEIRANVELEPLPTMTDPVVRGFGYLGDGLVIICDLEVALDANDSATLDAALVAHA